MTDSLPHLEAVPIVALGHVEVGDDLERARDVAIDRRARRARLEMVVDPIAAAPLAVVKQDQFVFAEVTHVPCP